MTLQVARLQPVAVQPSTLDHVLASVEAYYTAKLIEHGATPYGVDWSCQATQWLRFVQLLKVCAGDASYSLNDLGCGYGALATFLTQRYSNITVDYLGIDLSPTMVQRARRRHRRKPATRFVVGRTCPRRTDYAVASGIMNVMLGHTIQLWESFVRTVLIDMHRMSMKGFAVNFCSSLPKDVPPDQLYCCKPDTWSRFCEDELDCSVQILNNYGLREFTLLARRNGMMQPGTEASSWASSCGQKLQDGGLGNGSLDEAAVDT